MRRLYIPYSISMCFNLIVGTTDIAQKHISFVVVFKVATFVAISIKCFSHCVKIKIINQTDSVPLLLVLPFPNRLSNTLLPPPPPAGKRYLVNSHHGQTRSDRGASAESF